MTVTPTPPPELDFTEDHPTPDVEYLVVHRDRVDWHPLEFGGGFYRMPNRSQVDQTIVVTITGTEQMLTCNDMWEALSAAAELFEADPELYRVKPPKA